MKTAILLAMVWLSIPMTGFSSCNYPCEIDNPDESQRWAVPCVDAPPGTTITNEPCKECDGQGSITNKPNGTEVEVEGVAGRCCDGVWYAMDQAKEESECWEWDDSNCEYVCSDVPGPEIAADEMETVELECIWSIEPLPTVFATATDYCGNTVAVEQSPEGGGGVYGDGESATITLTAIDECGRSSTLDVVVEFAYECDTTSLQEARAELLRLMRDFIEGCELSDEAIGEIRDLYRRIQEINESFDPPLTQPEAGGHAGGLVGLLLIRWIG
ncbi:MAG TPA: hypothetical protein PLF51_19150, partial [Candidatus Hydrogenedentes bacterium]|nr:hypothetical protein [Candidatus Hydrogenedentota bacterium]